MKDLSGNLEPSLNVYPDYMAPIVMGNGDERVLTRARWGLPSSQKALLDATAKRADKLRAKGKTVDDGAFADLLKMEPDNGTTNVRNTKSKHWTRWLGTENRCVVPVTSFAEPDPANRPEGGRTPNAWFSVDESKPLAFFAGIWVPQWESVRKVREGLTRNDLYGFLTTEPNEIVAPIHQKAMPVILTTKEEVDVWLGAPWTEAQKLQRPLRDELLTLTEAPRQGDA